MKNLLLLLLLLTLSTVISGQVNPRPQRVFSGKALINDSLYGKGRLFEKGSLMFGSTIGFAVGFITGGGPAENFLGLQIGPNVNYFPIKRWSVGVNSIQYASWMTNFAPRYFWDLGIQSRYFFLNHRSVTVYPYVNYMFGNFDGYVNYGENYRRTQIYHKIRGGVGVNFRLTKALTFNLDLGWWHFLNKPKDMTGIGGLIYTHGGFNYVIKTRKK